MPSSAELVQAFKDLARPVGSGASAFSVCRITGVPHLLGKDDGGAPALLIRSMERGTRKPIALLNIQVQHGVRCSISFADTGVSEEALVSVVRCNSHDTLLRDYFVSVVAGAVEQLGAAPSALGVDRAIESLISLFAAIEQPARKTAQGIWAELVLIVASRVPGELIAAWHVDPDEAYDFSEGAARLEVKSYSEDARIHSFSLRQVRGGPPVFVAIASVRAERSAGGVSIPELLEALGKRVTMDLEMTARTTVAKSLGDHIAVGCSMRFDLQRAIASIRFFDSAKVPSVDPVLPPGVLRVRFDALLDEKSALTGEEVASGWPLVSRALPTSR